MKDISPALHYIDTLNNGVSCHGIRKIPEGLTAYIPSMGQMLIIDKLLSLLNTILEKLKLYTIGTGFDEWNFKCWTSTEYENGLYFLSGHNTNTTYDTQNKYVIFPLFKMKK